MDKISIIKQIVAHHPGYGTDRGWSVYTGGMVDSGYWLWDKLVDVPDDKLLGFLKELEKADKAVEKERIENERINKLPKAERDVIYLERHNKELQLQKEWFKQKEMDLMWGSKEIV